MVQEVERKGVSVLGLIGAGFFRPTDIAYLQGIGLDISPKNTDKIARAVRERLPISSEDSRNARYSLRKRIGQLGVTDDYSTLMLAYNRACDLGLIKPKPVSEPIVPLDKDEVKVLAFSAMAFVRGVIAQKLGISSGEVDTYKTSITGKFGVKTLFPVVAKVRKDMELQLQRAG